MKQEVLKCIKIKILLFFIISMIFLISFWIYLSCFCYVYQNTQIHLLKDTGLSFITSMITPFIISIFIGIFRIYALRAKNKDRTCMFRISKALQFFL